MMPLNIYHGALCPYCGKGRIFVDTKNGSKCGNCKKEFGLVVEMNNDGSHNKYLADKETVIDDFFAEFMNPPEKDFLDKYLII